MSEKDTFYIITRTDRGVTIRLKDEDEESAVEFTDVFNKLVLALIIAFKFDSMSALSLFSLNENQELELKGVNVGDLNEVKLDDLSLKDLDKE